jgi:SAM-dependent methyltransferase
VSGTIFDPAAADYDRLRPGYPAELYDALEKLSDVRLAGAVVVEGGTGTGIAAAQLAERGARVLGTDLSLAMLARHRLPGRVVAGRGEALPVRDGAADLLCWATAWHWVRQDEGLAEAVRVLRPGGALALWWNSWDSDAAPWRDEHFERLHELGSSTRYAGTSRYNRDELDGDLRESGLFTDVVGRELCWEREVSVEDHVAELGTHSQSLELAERLPGHLDERRRAVAERFPGGRVREPFLVHLHVARVPGDRR